MQLFAGCKRQFHLGLAAVIKVNFSRHQRKTPLFKLGPNFFDLGFVQKEKLSELREHIYEITNKLNALYNKQLTP